MFKAGVVLAGATLVASQVTVAEYCSALLAQCPGKHGIDSQANCLIVFDTTTADGYVIGTANESNVDSIECRYKFLTAPLNSSATKCQYAGPTGGGRCGSVVDGACRAATNACVEQGTPSSYADFSSCSTGLADLGAQWGWTQGAAAASEDTLECRAYHAITGLVSAAVHCGHYNRTGSPCEAGVPVPDATGTHYCETIMDACVGANAQYPDMVSCKKIATAFVNFPNDTRASNQNNSLGCREYHAQASKAVDPAVHCEHAGPSGGMACGLSTSYAQAWATIAKGVCNDSNVEAALTALGAAQLALAVPDRVAANGKYSTTSDTNNNTQACRIYHLTVAATGAVSHCSHGSLHGDSQCGGTPAATFCKFAEGVCGFGTAAYQFASSTACMTAAGNVSLGTGADRSQNTLGCRFYHLGVAGSYKAGGNMMANATLMQQHCAHVLVPGMGAGGCGVATAPTAAPMAPTAAKNSAAALTLSAAFIAVFSTLAL
jgi:hypothetical protein